MTAFTQAYNGARSKEGLMRLQSDGIDMIRTRASILPAALVLAVAAIVQPARARLEPAAAGEALSLAMGRRRRARRGEPADAAGGAEGDPDDPRGQGLRIGQGAGAVDSEIRGALLLLHLGSHLRPQRPQPAARQRRDGVHRARPDRHSVRRPGAPGAG